MRNQFGQDINVGDCVGHAYKTGSYTIRRVGVVQELAAKVDGWDYASREARYSQAVKVQWADTGKQSTVFINTVFKLDPASLGS